jgi:hypothetical protein
MKKAVFWDVAPCGSCMDRRFGSYNSHTAPRVASNFRVEKISGRGRMLVVNNASLLLELSSLADIFYPQDGGYMFHRNVGSYKTHTAPHPRRLHSSSYQITFTTF